MCVGMQLERKGILDWLRMAAARPEVTFLWYGRTDPRMLTAAVSRALACGTPCWCGGPLYREQFPDGVLTYQVAEEGPDLPGREASRLSPGGDRRATAPSLPRGAVRDAAHVAPR